MIKTPPITQASLLIAVMFSLLLMIALHADVTETIVTGYVAMETVVMETVVMETVVMADVTTKAEVVVTISSVVEIELMEDVPVTAVDPQLVCGAVKNTLVERSFSSVD